MDTDFEYLGEHYWKPQGPGYIIVGFEVWKTTWEGKPSRSGWDNPVKTEVADRFANAQDADAREMELRGQGLKNVSFYTLPLQVKCPVVL